MRCKCFVRFGCALFGLLVCASAAPARADLIEYNVPGLDIVVMLHGKQNANPGRTITYTHAKFGQLILGLSDVEKVHTVPPNIEIYSRKFNTAVQKKNVEQVMDAARWALGHGLVPQCFAAVDKALELDPKHVDALRVKDLKGKMETPIGDSAVQEKELRDLVRRSSMKIAQSKHFILLYDTPETFDKKVRKKPRAEERLDLLELVYESFLLKFYSQGIALEIPKERLKVVLFNDEKDFLTFTSKVHPTAKSIAGFWDPKTNTSVFYDNGKSEQFKVFRDITSVLKKAKEAAIKARDAETRDTVRMANTIMMLNDIIQENEDISTVSHEATHQMAGNTGLLPRDVMIPSWAHEGLASYFEAPSSATWSGIGAVNADRLKWYRGLENDREHSNIDFIVGDQIFKEAGGVNSNTIHAYGQAWAMTHFLMEKHFDKFITYYRRLGELPPDVIFSPDLLTKVFDEVFGTDRQSLDFEWRDYMNSLKTDTERITKER